MPVADHARLAGGLVRRPAGSSTEQLAARARGDVLDLADDPVAVAVDVELGDLAAVVGHAGTWCVPAGARVVADVAGVVGGGDGDAVGGRRPPPPPSSAAPQAARVSAVRRRAAAGRTRAGTSGSSAHAAAVSGIDAGGGAATARRAVPLRRAGQRKSDQDRHEVEQPGDRLEHGGGGGDVEQPESSRAVPAGRVEHAGDVEGRVASPGRTPASWKSWTPYLRMPAATKISRTPLTVKNLAG